MKSTETEIGKFARLQVEYERQKDDTLTWWRLISSEKLGETIFIHTNSSEIDEVYINGERVWSK